MITVEPFEIIIVKFLWEQLVVKRSNEFENGCILIHCGAQMVIYRL